MGAKTHHLACPGFSASEDHILTSARTGLKRQSKKQDFSETSTYTKGHYISSVTIEAFFQSLTHQLLRGRKQLLFTGVPEAGSVT